jgi:Ca2+-binding RTX toxin-like protein
MQTTSSAGTGAINLTGNALAQRIFGNAGNNRIDGKGGNDTLNGGAGADVFVFSTAAGVGNVDRIAGFVSADQIEIENAVFTGLVDTNAPLTTTTFTFNNSGLATQTGQRIIYQTTTGSLFYDADGSAGPALSVHFATVDLGTVLAANDFTVI